MEAGNGNPVQPSRDPSHNTARWSSDKTLQKIQAFGATVTQLEIQTKANAYHAVFKHVWQRPTFRYIWQHNLKSGEVITNLVHCPAEKQPTVTVLFTSGFIIIEYRSVLIDNIK